MYRGDISNRGLPIILVDMRDVYKKKGWFKYVPNYPILNRLIKIGGKYVVYAVSTNKRLYRKFLKDPKVKTYGLRSLCFTDEEELKQYVEFNDRVYFFISSDEKLLAKLSKKALELGEITWL